MLKLTVLPPQEAKNKVLYVSIILTAGQFLKLALPLPPSFIKTFSEKELMTTGNLNQTPRSFGPLWGGGEFGP
jgi:hypothetical protein